MSPIKKTTKAPKHLSASTRRWFEDVLKTFVLESHHLRLLTLAGEAWDRGQQARESLKVTGTVFEDRFGCPRARPEVAIERDSRLAFARLVRELALDIDNPTDSRPPRAGGQRY